MILKVRKPGGWVLFDNVVKAEVVYPNKSMFRFNRTAACIEAKTEDAGWQEVIHTESYIDRWRIGFPETPGTKEISTEFIPLAEAHITRPKGDALVTELILFTEGYLMNENGKTLERII